MCDRHGITGAKMEGKKIMAKQGSLLTGNSEEKNKL
jgi:hypothetical protein